jgi:hypothetical protein
VAPKRKWSDRFNAGAMTDGKSITKSLMNQPETLTWIRTDIQLSPRRQAMVDKKRAQEAELNAIIKVPMTSDYRELCAGEKPVPDFPPDDRVSVSSDPLVSGKFKINSDYRAHIGNKKKGMIDRSSSLPDLPPNRSQRFQKASCLRGPDSKYAEIPQAPKQLPHDNFGQAAVFRMWQKDPKDMSSFGAMLYNIDNAEIARLKAKRR